MIGVGSFSPEKRAWAAALAAMALGLGCSSPDGLAPAPSASPPNNQTLLSACTAADALQGATVEEYIASIAHGWSYTPLTVDQMNALITATHALDEGDLITAESSAQSVAYEVKPLVTPSGCFIVLRPTTLSPSGQATLVYSASWERNLIIEAPHVPEDHRTDEEAGRLFSALGAKAVLLAGAHRCAATTPSGCHSSAFCNPLGNAVESDAGHSVSNALNAMHLAFRNSQATILQLHTNFKPMLNGDAQVSNGTPYPIPGAVSDAFFAAFRSSGMDVRTCNDPAAPPPHGAFCGETSTESLASNGAPDQCVGRPTAKGEGSAHRFIHLEQNNQRMDSLEAWTVQIATALTTAISPSR